MKILPLIAISTLISSPALAEEVRQLDAHEHGVGHLDIAFEGQQIAMQLHAPGADIVGFEYEAKTAEDRTSIDSAVAKLAQPLTLFVLPEAAQCSVVQASAALESEEEHHDHGAHDDHAADHGHEDHDDHAADHGHKDHDKHGEDHAHDHDAHAASHSEFHAEYLLTCADPAAASEITFAYFDAFPNARELEIQMISESGATAFEVSRDSPILDLRGMF
ncbi:DUF2796 domain-containing protein [Roseobacter denitrificans]|uniref:Zinc-binding protein n=1 Tax=Roseobacter denitrificans (strain ATCC 33942 / OCh 114) TaxID=375451 RepID=Q169I2_ROSDO|nr:DUF2796 domain-containing protein [Roseobacter denitrificans]ABG31361.1 hypothetical protein RD1_1739 [Roseobacter denitrificans OCh 114]AVL54384.1 DUF2796 domain-containing protein [Roseobacter denitrificans]SFG00014.1 Protein of unknown function [Roseobacter denitrificans OCh 114]